MRQTLTPHDFYYIKGGAVRLLDDEGGAHHLVATPLDNPPAVPSTGVCMFHLCHKPISPELPCL